MSRIFSLLLSIAVCLGTTSVGAKASDYEWLQDVQRSWKVDDPVQNNPVHVVSGEAIVATPTAQYVVTSDKTISQLTDANSDTDSGDESVWSADRETIYEIDLAESNLAGGAGLLDHIDLWNNNSSEFRNAANVEIQVSFDGNSFKTVCETGNLVGEKPNDGSCNLLTFDLSDQTEPVRKLRIVDKIAVTAQKGPLSPVWLEWDVFIKK